MEQEIVRRAPGCKAGDLCIAFNMWGKKVKKLIKLKDVLAVVPYSRSQIYAMISEGKFPRQRHFGGSAAFWVEEEVASWIQAHIDADDAQWVKEHAEDVAA